MSTWIYVIFALVLLWTNWDWLWTPKVMKPSPKNPPVNPLNCHINCHRCSRSFHTSKPPINCHDLVCKYYTPNNLGLPRHPIEIIEESADLAKRKKHHKGNDVQHNNEVLLTDTKKRTYPVGAMVDAFHPQDPEAYAQWKPGQKWQGDHWVD